MIANYYQRTFTIIQSNFGGFLHYKNIIQQKQKNIILNQNNDMLNYSKCTLRTVAIIRSYLSLLHPYEFSDNFSDTDGFKDGGYI